MRPLAVLSVLLACGEVAPAAVDATASVADAGVSDGGERAPDATAALDGDTADAAPAPPACPATTTVTLDRATVALSWWPGDAAPSAVLALSASDPACESLHASADAPWLVVSADPRAGTLALRVDGASVTSGDHRATVSVSTAPGAAVVARAQVTLRAWVSAGAEAPRRVLVIGLDGVRADALAVADTPHVDLLAGHGFATFAATTQLTGPTVSGPGWASIFTGVEARRHRILANGGWSAFDRRHRTFLWEARTSGLRTAAACNWTPILDEILEDDALDWSARGDDDRVTDALAALIRDGLHDVYYLHLNDPDAAGHAAGFSAYGAEYIAALEAADVRIGRLLDALFARPAFASEEWLVIVTTDHGGEGRDHGPLSEACRRIPLIVAGPSAQRDHLASSASHLDVAATVLRFLALPPSGPALDGLPIGLAFEGRCGDGLDDDGDGQRDCADADCAADPRCSGAAPACPGQSLGSALGLGIARADTGTATAWHTGSCGGTGGELTFEWRAPADDTYTFDTIGSDYDTVLYARQGCEGAELACNQDYYPGPRQDVPIGRQSGIRLSLRAGEPIVLVADATAGGGALVLNAHAVGASCPDRALSSAVGAAIATGNNTAAPSRFVASCAGMARDTALTWTAPADGEYVFDTMGSSFDTVLTLRAGSCGETELACNDDVRAGALESRVVRTMTAGELVTIVVGGFRGRSGDWTLAITRR